MVTQAKDSTVANGSTSSATRKMTTRTSTGSIPPPKVSSSRDEDERDPRDSSSSRQDQRDPSPPSPEEITEAERASAAQAARGTAEPSHADAPAPVGPDDIDTPSKWGVGLPSASSFEMGGALGPSASFGGLSALGLVDDGATACATNATPKHGARHVAANLPSMTADELNGDGWDILNQDSFGFNLLDGPGSLSFDTSGVETDPVVAGSGGEMKKERGRNMDLTSAVTASLEDTPRKHQQMDWQDQHNGAPEAPLVNGVSHNWIPPHSPLQPSAAYRESRSDTHHRHNSGQQGGYYVEHRDGNYEDPFKYAFGNPNTTTGTAPHPGHRSKSAGSSSRRSGSNGRSGSSSRKSKKRKHPRPEPSSTRSQHSLLGEPLDGRHSPPALPTIESAPTATLDMNHPPGPPPVEHTWSASPDIRRSQARKSHRSKSGRSSSRRTGDKRSSSSRHARPDVASAGRASTWSGVPSPTSSGHAPPPRGHPPHMPRYPHWPGHPPPPPGSDPNIHSAFLPPVPTQSGPGYAAPPGGGANGNAPPREVFITTKGGSGKPPAPAPYHPYHHPYHHHPHHLPHHHMPYGYPPAPPPGRGLPPPGAPQPPVPPSPQATRKRSSSSTRTPANAAPQQRGPRRTGVDLLTLPDGRTLSRAQAPGIGWPPSEDLRLTEVMSNHKSSTADWEALSVEHGMGRSARECHDRWTRYLKPGSRKGQWKEEEDAIVLRVIFATSNGPPGTANNDGSEPHPPFTQWADLAPQLPGRTGKQIRDRWVNYLNPAINHLPFSREDDLRLWRGHKELGKRWVEISVKVFHSARSENHIKNRWYSAAFKKFIAKEFGMDAYVDAKQQQVASGSVVGVVSGSGASTPSRVTSQQPPRGGQQYHHHPHQYGAPPPPHPHMGHHQPV